LFLFKKKQKNNNIFSKQKQKQVGCTFLKLKTGFSQPWWKQKPKLEPCYDKKELRSWSYAHENQELWCWIQSHVHDKIFIQWLTTSKILKILCGWSVSQKVCEIKQLQWCWDSFLMDSQCQKLWQTKQHKNHSTGPLVLNNFWSQKDIKNQKLKTMQVLKT